MSGLMRIAVGAAGVCLARAYVLPGGTAPRVSPAGEAVADYSVPDPAAPAAAGEAHPSSWNPLAFGVALGLFAAVVAGRAPTALAADLENGEQIFGANCAACHAGGNNTVVPEKKLKKEALQQYGKYEVAQIITQVTNGNGAMPAFGERIAPEDIEDVANYVRSQADKGW